MPADPDDAPQEEVPAGIGYEVPVDRSKKTSQVSDLRVLERQIRSCGSAEVYKTGTAGH